MKDGETPEGPLGRRGRRSGERRPPETDQSVIVNVSPLVVSSSVTLSHWTDIGGVQSGWKVAVTVKLKSAFPFWTGKSPTAEKLALLPAFGWFPPGLMHWASAVTTTCICASSPRPASLPLTVRVSPDSVTVIALRMKCGLP